MNDEQDATVEQWHVDVADGVLALHDITCDPDLANGVAMQTRMSNADWEQFRDAIAQEIANAEQAGPATTLADVLDPALTIGQLTTAMHDAAAGLNVAFDATRQLLQTAGDDVRLLADVLAGRRVTREFAQTIYTILRHVDQHNRRLAQIRDALAAQAEETGDSSQKAEQRNHEDREEHEEWSCWRHAERPSSVARAGRRAQVKERAT